MSGAPIPGLVAELTEIARVDAENYKTVYAATLALTVGTIRVANEGAVNTALGAYNALSAEAKAKLTAEKTLLDSLTDQIEALKIAAVVDAANFRTTHAAILTETVDTLTVEDKDALFAARTAYDALIPEAKANLTAEKTILDALYAKMRTFPFRVSGTIALQGRASGKLGGVTITLSIGGETAFTTTTDTSGNYVFDLVPMNDYMLKVERAGYLSYQKTALTVEDDVIPGLISLKGGDINGDGQVTSTDLSTLLSLYLNTTTATSDINGDGQVTSTDLSVLLSNYLVSKTVVD